jgi:hypothetical protein
MPNYSTYRTFHLWMGLILLVPMSVIAATGILWNHEKTLGLKGKEGYAEKPEKAQRQRSQASAESPALTLGGNPWREQEGAVAAALAAARETWTADAPIERIELRNEPGLGPVVKVKIMESAGLEGPEEIVWSVAAAQIVERKGDPRDGMDWAKLVHDLHTGKFFSKNLGFLWSDSSALSILLLGITGVVLYVLPIFKKRANQKKRAGAGQEGLPVAPRPLLRATRIPVSPEAALVVAPAGGEG